MERLTRLVDGEMEAATLEHNEMAALDMLAGHLSWELNRVVKRQVELADAAGNVAHVHDEDDPVYPEDDYALTTLPPTSDDDDEQDAEADDSDHGEYDPWAFANGH